MEGSDVAGRVRLPSPNGEDAIVVISHTSKESGHRIKKFEKKSERRKLDGAVAGAKQRKTTFLEESVDDVHTSGEYVHRR